MRALILHKDRPHEWTTVPWDDENWMDRSDAELDDELDPEAAPPFNAFVVNGPYLDLSDPEYDSTYQGPEMPLFAKRGIYQRQLGADDGFEIEVDITYDTIERFYHQVGPSYGNGGDWRAPTITSWWDYTMGLMWYGCYAHAPEQDWADRLEEDGMPYAINGIDFSFHVDQSTPPGGIYDWYANETPVWERYHTGPEMKRRHRFGLRVLDGMVEATYQGKRVWGPVPVPEALIADSWGVDALHLRPQWLVPVERKQDARVRRFRYRPISGTLGEYPKATVVGSAKATSASGQVTIPLPAGAAIGDAVVVFAAADGAIQTPTGGGSWGSLGSRTHSSMGRRLSVFHCRRLTSLGDVTVAAGTSAPIAVVLYVERNQHPTLALGADFAESATPGTATEDPNGWIGFGPKLRLWACTADEDAATVTPPEGMEVLQQTDGPRLCVATGLSAYTVVEGQGGVDVNFPGPIPSVEDPLVGGLSTSSDHVTAHAIRFPDPR